MDANEMYRQEMIGKIMGRLKEVDTSLQGMLLTYDDKVKLNSALDHLKGRVEQARQE